MRLRSFCKQLVSLGSQKTCCLGNFVVVIVIIMDDDVYYHTFQDGPMGVGLEPPPGESVGSIVSVVVENSQAYNSDSIRVGDAVEKIGNEDITYCLYGAATM